MFRIIKKPHSYFGRLMLRQNDIIWIYCIIGIPKVSQLSFELYEGITTVKLCQLLNFYFDVVFCLANWYWVYRPRFHCSLFSFMLVSLDLTFSLDEISHCKPSTYFINRIKGYEVSMLFLILDESKRSYGLRIYHFNYFVLLGTPDWIIHCTCTCLLYSHNIGSSACRKLRLYIQNIFTYFFVSCKHYLSLFNPHQTPSFYFHLVLTLTTDKANLPIGVPFGSTKSYLGKSKKRFSGIVIIVVQYL